VQPTIVETISFLAWKDEAYRLGDDWAHCHPADSPSRKLIAEVMDRWYLVNIVNNDFHQTHTIFDIFKDLTIKNMDRAISPPAVPVEEHPGHIPTAKRHELTRNDTPTPTQSIPIRSAKKAGRSPIRN